MEGTHDSIRRHAEKDLTAIRHRLDSGRRMGVKETHALATIADRLTSTLRNLDEIESRKHHKTIGFDTGRHESDKYHGIEGRKRRTRSENPYHITSHLDHEIHDDFEDEYDKHEDIEMKRGRKRDRYGRFAMAEHEAYARGVMDAMTPHKYPHHETHKPHITNKHETEIHDTNIGPTGTPTGRR